MDLETLGDPSVNSPVQTLHLMFRRKIVACKLCFEGGLSPSHAQLKGYQAQFLDYIQHGMMVQSSKEMFVGPCNIDLQKNSLPVSTQLWPEVRIIIREANQLMLPFVELMGVTTSQLSPFVKCSTP